MTAVSSKGLYLWASDFWADKSPQVLIADAKDNISEDFLKRYAPQLFAARASAAFNGQPPQAIDNFFKGTTNSEGFVSRLQGELDKYYSQEMRNFYKIFTNKINSILKNGLSSVEKSFTDKDRDTFYEMKQAQDNIFDGVSRLASFYEIYLAERCAQNNLKMPRMKKNGLYSIGNIKNNAVLEAINIYNEIKSKAQQLESVKVTDNIEHSFVAFRDTLKGFAPIYAEYAALAAIYSLKKGHKELFKNSILDAHHTGSERYIAGQGGISVNIKEYLDPEFQKLINDNPLPPGASGTATNDVSISINGETIVANYGGSVKEYSDEKLKATGNFVITSSSMGDIYTAAALATQRGLPISMADKTWIINLAGALTDESQMNTANAMWEDYKQTLANFLIIDSLMGKMLNTDISNKANNLLMIDNGRVYYLGDIISKLSGNIKGFLSNREEGKIESHLTKGIEPNSTKVWIGSTRVRDEAENAHWKNFSSGKSASEAYDAIDNIILKERFKIALNFHQLLGLI